MVAMRFPHLAQQPLGAAPQWLDKKKKKSKSWLGVDWLAHNPAHTGKMLWFKNVLPRPQSQSLEARGGG